MSADSLGRASYMKSVQLGKALLAISVAGAFGLLVWDYSQPCDLEQAAVYSNITTTVWRMIGHESEYHGISSRGELEKAISFPSELNVKTRNWDGALRGEQWVERDVVKYDIAFEVKKENNVVFAGSVAADSCGNVQVYGIARKSWRPQAN